MLFNSNADDSLLLWVIRIFFIKTVTLFLGFSISLQNNINTEFSSF